MKRLVCVLAATLITTVTCMAHARYFSNAYSPEDPVWEDGHFSTVTVVDTGVPEDFLYVAAGEHFKKGEGYVPTITILDHLGHVLRTHDVRPLMDEVKNLDSFANTMSGKVLVVGETGSTPTVAIFDAPSAAAGTTLDATVAQIPDAEAIKTVEEGRVVPYGVNKNYIVLVGSFFKPGAQSSDYWITMLNPSLGMEWEKIARNPEKCVTGAPVIYDENLTSLDFSADTIIVAGTFKKAAATKASHTYNLHVFQLDYLGGYTGYYWTYESVLIIGGERLLFDEVPADISYVLDVNEDPVDIVVSGWTNFAHPSLQESPLFFPKGGKSMLLAKPDLNTACDWLWGRHFIPWDDDAKELTQAEAFAHFINSDDQIVAAGNFYRAVSGDPADGMVARFSLSEGKFDRGRKYGEYNLFRTESEERFADMRRIKDDFVVVGQNESIVEERGFSDAKPWLYHAKENLQGGYVEPFSSPVYPEVEPKLNMDDCFPCHPEFDLIKPGATNPTSQVCSPAVPSAKIPLPSGRTPGWLYDSTTEFRMSLVYKRPGITRWEVRRTQIDEYGNQTHYPMVNLLNSYDVVAMGDFNGDEITDLLVRHNTNGTNFFVIGKISSSLTWAWDSLQPTAPQADYDWEVRGSIDFDSNGEDDILWWNSTTGEGRILMNMLSAPGVIGLPTVSNTDFEMVGAADLARDEHPEVFYANSTWIIFACYDGASWTGTNLITKSNNEEVSTLGDWNADGHTDIILRNTSNGQNRAVLLPGECAPGMAPIGTAVIPDEPNTDWSIIGN